MERKKTPKLEFNMKMSFPGTTYLICKHESMAVVPPPNTHTVKNTIRSVVLNIICRA